MKLISNGTTKTTLVVLVVLALIFVGLSAFAYPALSPDERSPEKNGSNSKSTLDADEEGTEGIDDPVILAFVVKGEVLDEEGNPIAGARVTLYGPIPLIEPVPADDDDILEDTVEPIPRMITNPRTKGDPADGTDDNPIDGTDNHPIDGIEDTDNDDNQDDIILPEPPVQRRVTFTDDWGVFTFRGVPGGRYVLVVEAKGFFSHKQRLQVDDDTKLLIRLKHKPAFRLHATPIDGDGDGIADDVIVYASTQDNRPLGGVMIYIDGLYKGATSFEGWLFAMDFTPGHHRVKGLHYQDQAYTSFWIQGQVQPNYGALKGVVFGDDPTGPAHNPIAGAKVEIFTPFPILYPINEELDEAGNGLGKMTDPDSAEMEVENAELLRYYASTTTDRNGKFAFEKVPAGRYMMRVSARGFRTHSEIIGIRAGEVTYVKVLLKPVMPGALKGVVLEDDPTGHMIKPIPGARVEIFSPYPTPYPIPLPYPIPKPDPIPMPTPIPDPVEVQDFDIEGEEYLAGLELDDDSRPMSGLEKVPIVRYYDSRITDENGQFAFEKVPEGTYMMRVSAKGFHSYRELVTIKGGEVTYVKVLLKPILPGSLIGVVFEDDPTGPTIEPIAGAKVEIFTPYLKPTTASHDSFVDDIDPSVFYYDVTYTNEDGEFTFEKVPEGKYAIRVTADGYREYRSVVKIKGGEVTTVRILLKPITWVL